MWSISHKQPFPPPFMPGHLPIPLSQKSPFVPPNIPPQSAPVVSTIMRPSSGMAPEGKSQSPVASSTPQTAGVEPTDTQTGGGNVTPGESSSILTGIIMVEEKCIAFKLSHF